MKRQKSYRWHFRCFSVHSTLVMLLLLWTATAALAQTTQAAPATEPHRTSKPGPAQKTAHEPARKAAAGAAEPWTKIPIPPLPAFHPPQPKRVELPNGMILFLQEDHELPLITVMARIRGGARIEPQEKTGLVDLYGEVWRTGGTKTKTGDQMDDFLEARAAKLETDGGMDATTISLNCLKGDFNDVFSLFVELLREPAFRADKLALAKRELDTEISRRNDDVGEIASRESVKLAYGKDNPYVRIPEYATVAAVTREDLVNWHDRFVYPNNIILGVVGDFNSDAMEAKLKEAFGSWARGPEPPKLDVEFHEPKPGLYYVNKEEVNQSVIRMVALGIRRDNPDYYAVTVMNEILGGGFASRLIADLRTKQGLAYAVGGGIGSSFDHPGIFMLGMGTKTATTAEGIKGLNQEIADLLSRPPTQQELRRAKDAILNSFIFHFDSPEKVMQERMAYEFYGYPLDFLERYRSGVEKVTVEDVNRVIHKYVHPGMFAVLVVGNSEADKEVASLGPATKLDISIPPPPASEEAAQPALQKQ